jgi:hypothetical protein
VLELIDESLESFFRAAVPLGATDIDVAFDAPNREWSAKLTRPTVNVFLWDIRRSASRSSTGIRTVNNDGVTVRQHVLPVLELRYVLTAWTSDLGDERALLAGLVRALLAFGEIPREFMASGLDMIDIPTLTMARAGEDHMDVFKAVEGQLKPGVNMVVTTQFDTGRVFPVAPSVGEIGTSIGRMNGSGDGERRRIAGEILDAEQRQAIGAVVRSPGHASRVDPLGRFLIRAAAGDEIVVEVDPPLVATVPVAGGVRFE